MNEEDVRTMIGERVGPVETALQEFIASEKDGRQVMTNLLTRLSIIVAGDKEFGQVGLTQRVSDLEAFKSDQRALTNKGEGAARAAVWIIGGLFTLLNIGIKMLW